jgi:hypothetical protein
VRVDRRLRNGLSVIGHYTWSKSIDVGGANFIAGDGVYRNPRDIEMDRGLSSSDVRHNMVLSYIWDIPVGRGRRFALGNAWLNGLLGGWQFIGITTARRHAVHAEPQHESRERRTCAARPTGRRQSAARRAIRRALVRSGRLCAVGPLQLRLRRAQHPDRAGLLQHRFRSLQAVRVRRRDAAQRDPDPDRGVQRLQRAALPAAERDRRSARCGKDYRDRRDDAGNAGRNQVSILK